MLTPKLKWSVSDKPTGRYRSFERRVWPTACFQSKGVHGFDEPGAQILCEDEYRPSDVKAGNHGPLTVMVVDHSHKPVWAWRTLSKRCATLAEAKALVDAFYAQHPEWLPVTPVTTPPEEGNQQNVTKVPLT